MTKSKSGEEPVQQDEEAPDRVVDPPEASSADTTDPEQSSEQQWVLVEQTAMLTLPSGASYNLQAGNVMQLSPEDASFVIDQGYASETSAPSQEVEAEAPSEE